MPGLMVLAASTATAAGSTADQRLRSKGWLDGCTGGWLDGCDDGCDDGLSAATTAATTAGSAAATARPPQLCSPRCRMHRNPLAQGPASFLHLWQLGSEEHAANAIGRGEWSWTMVKKKSRRLHVHHLSQHNSYVALVLNLVPPHFGYSQAAVFAGLSRRSRPTWNNGQDMQTAQHKRTNVNKFCNEYAC